DKVPLSSQSSFVAGPGIAALVGRGTRAAPPSTGLNFVVYDVATAAPLVAMMGSGTNLFPGNDRITQVSMDFAPSFLASKLFAVPWVEHVMPADYDALYFQRLQCDSH